MNERVFCELPPSYDVRFDLSNPNETLIRKNLETDLGERFNVQISQVDYFFEDKLLKSPLHSEPFSQVIKRGIQERKKYAGNHDRLREFAELEGFEKVQRYFLENKNPYLKVIVISPSGPKNSCYQHNFFDIYELKEKNQLLMTRYSSQMSTQEFLEAARLVDLDFGQGEIVDDIYFLKNPIKSTQKKEELLAIFHPDYQALPKEELEKLFLALAPFINSYLTSVKEKDILRSKKARKAIYNFADDYVFKPKAQKLLEHQLTDESFLPYALLQFAARPVRFTITGCGTQGDEAISNFKFQISNFMPYSVAEFAKNCPECKGSDNHFHCPRCQGQIESGRGITTCPHCGLTKEEAGSKCA